MQPKTHAHPCWICAYLMIVHKSRVSYVKINKWLSTGIHSYLWYLKHANMWCPPIWEIFSLCENFLLQSIFHISMKLKLRDLGLYKKPKPSKHEHLCIMHRLDSHSIPESANNCTIIALPTCNKNLLRTCLETCNFHIKINWGIVWVDWPFEAQDF